VWSIADITRDRARQEDDFQYLQDAIQYLDHAPCGFFSVSPAGVLTYVNATLASWLDQDLADIGSGGAKLTDIISGDGAALLTAIAPAPGEVKTEVFDLDCAPATASRCRCGSITSWRSAPTARRAPRARLSSTAPRDERADPQRAAEVRFMRFFDHTPMAIAAVDRAGTIVRSNARFAKLAQSVGSPAAASKSILEVLGDRDRTQLVQAIGEAAEGKSDIAPVEAMLDDKKERWVQFFVTGVENDGRDAEAAIVYLPRDHRAPRAAEPDEPGAEDGDGRPACRRHGARLQTRAVGDPDGERLPAVVA